MKILLNSCFNKNLIVNTLVINSMLKSFSNKEIL